jgi:DNA-binding NarL/FixJ family response regulator
MITVILADDHAILRDGLRFLLEAAGDIEIISTAANGQEAVEQASLHCPDVVVMDISMPVMSGIEATKHIARLCEHTKVTILSMHHTTEYIQRAMEAGAVGYLLKDSAGAELVTAIRAVNDGKRYISRSVAKTFGDGKLPWDRNRTS